MLRNITPYLFFNGNCKQALDFYSEVLSGRVSSIMTYGEANETSTDDPERIIHAKLDIDGQTFMLSDIPRNEQSSTKDRNVYIVLDFDSEEAVNTAYERLKEGGQVQIELANMFWGAKYAKLIDKFNIGWDLNYTYPQSEQ
ncbi:glyoxalase/bleomycin resistance/extradiol dioxygenase family protein [Staphylococcus gallinarum]|uniref:Glyoxalase/bleomycin resistance/extradiol dioxygenase family protein n=1 Tax=Staphylococcus gallinarum TaxID=1293 RepID=A0A3A0VR84_STAGA|nr:glyoxalase/bleomycin resistance/extradiol dioxygenase family protein [Staphylococcus gallinarum]RIP37064.1 glyoxalase/bleomycin resistance/extradiol dioxygenase family protein [Staphylococcus gallinarum]